MADTRIDACGRLIKSALTALFVSLTFLAGPGLSAAIAADNEYVLTLKDNVFVEDTLKVPADTKFVLKVVNQDATTEEFESHDLHIEKLVSGNRTITLRIGPLKPGTYEFVGEFHEDSAKGRLIVEAAQ